MELVPHLTVVGDEDGGFVVVVVAAAVIDIIEHDLDVQWHLS